MCVCVCVWGGGGGGGSMYSFYKQAGEPEILMLILTIRTNSK